MYYLGPVRLAPRRAWNNEFHLKQITHGLCVSRMRTLVRRCSVINLRAAACASLPIFTISKSAFPRTVPLPISRNRTAIRGNLCAALFVAAETGYMGNPVSLSNPFCEVFLKKIHWGRMADFRGFSSECADFPESGPDSARNFSTSGGARPGRPNMCAGMPG